MIKGEGVGFGGVLLVVVVDERKLGVKVVRLQTLQCDVNVAATGGMEMQDGV